MAATEPSTGLVTHARRDDEPEYGHDALVVCDNVVRIYQTETIEVQALQGLDLLVTEGEMVAVVGASGSGKSTLLQVLAGLDAPTAGRARVADHDLLAMSRSERVHYRRHVVGFVRQQTARNLVPYLTAREVVDLPMSIAGVARRDRARRAGELLEAVGVAHCGDRRPHQMSGGEQQRVAICVALANRPRVLLADEPTGELDSETAQDVFDALRTANRDLDATVVVVTHDPAVSGQVARTIAIRDGRTSSEVLRSGEAPSGTVVEAGEEYAVMDRAGRVQVPKEFRDALALTRRVRLSLAEDRVEIRNDAAPDVSNVTDVTDVSEVRPVAPAPGGPVAPGAPVAPPVPVAPGAPGAAGAAGAAGTRGATGAHRSSGTERPAEASDGPRHADRSGGGGSARGGGSRRHAGPARRAGEPARPLDPLGPDGAHGPDGDRA